MKIRNNLFILLSLSIAGLFSACKKENSNSTLQVKLTDNPAAYQEVNIDLIGVSVKLSKDTTKWVELEPVVGVYNLLGLQNGLDTLIGTLTLPTAIVKEIRLVLGPNNTIKVNDTIYPLTIPSGDESGLKIKVSKKLEATIETLIIDFDAALSIKEEGPGVYKLKPVLKIKP